MCVAKLHLGTVTYLTTLPGHRPFLGDPRLAMEAFLKVNLKISGPREVPATLGEVLHLPGEDGGIHLPFMSCCF